SSQHDVVVDKRTGTAPNVVTGAVIHKNQRERPVRVLSRISNTNSIIRPEDSRSLGLWLARQPGQGVRHYRIGVRGQLEMPNYRGQWIDYFPLPPGRVRRNQEPNQP